MICSECHNFRLVKLGSEKGYCLYHKREARGKDGSCQWFV